MSFDYKKATRKIVNKIKRIGAQLQGFIDQLAGKKKRKKKSQPRVSGRDAKTEEDKESPGFWARLTGRHRSKNNEESERRWRW